MKNQVQRYEKREILHCHDSDLLELFKNMSTNNPAKDIINDGFYAHTHTAAVPAKAAAVVEESKVDPIPLEHGRSLHKHVAKHPARRVRGRDCRSRLLIASKWRKTD